MKKIVIKVGSSTLSAGTPSLCPLAMQKLSEQISQLCLRGYDVVLVSSGAILAGKEVMKNKEKALLEKQTMPTKQMLAAIGQVYLMHMWKKLFEKHPIIVAQILLTKHDILNPHSLENARNTFQALLSHRIVPIVNENDTTATDEIKFGDNDTLSAQVAILCEADLLILLTDQDGLYTDDPRRVKDAKKLSHIEKIDEKVHALAGVSSHPLGIGTGGMSTKIISAELATQKGIATIITALSASPTLLDIVLGGKTAGTYFEPTKR